MKQNIHFTASFPFCQPAKGNFSIEVFSFPLNKVFSCWSSSQLHRFFSRLPEQKLIKKWSLQMHSGGSPNLKWVFKRRNTVPKCMTYIPVENSHDFGSDPLME